MQCIFGGKYFFVIADSIILNVSAELYNLTNASYLYQKDSYGFLDHMTKFCTEVSYYVLQYKNLSLLWLKTLHK